MTLLRSWPGSWPAHSFGRTTQARRLATAAFGLTVGVVLGLGPMAQAAGTGQVKGVAKLVGKVPPAKELNMKADPFCATKNARDEELLVSPSGQIKNVVVRIAKGATGPFPVPAAEVTLDQDGCAYRPRVAVAQAGQVVLIKNSDQTLHNVHTYKGPATLFNQAQPQGFPALKKKFMTPGDIIKFKCDVHPWMTGWALVTDNPFFAITGDDGSFSIDKLPAGTYTVEAWHEKLGTKTQEIKVTEGKPVELKFEFSAR